MEEPKNTKTDRVRRNSPNSFNDSIDKEIFNELTLYKGKDPSEISKRIDQLEKEWSIERRIETFASSLVIIGVLAGYFNKKWLLLPGIVATFLLQHGVQGWCPPVPLFRALNARTRKEIDWEKYSLKFLRGDFDQISKTKTQEIFQAVKKL